MENKSHTTHKIWSESNPSETTGLLEDILSHQSGKVPQFINKIPELVIGRILSIDDSGKLLIHYPLAERPVLALSLGRVEQFFIGRMCTVQFAGGNLSHPIVTGILSNEWINTQNEPEPDVLDAKQVVLKAEEELVLQCGESKIILSADGLIQVRALYIDNQAQATLRLKGGSVQVN